MPPCHVQPFVLPGVIVAATPAAEQTPRDDAPSESCDYCASPRLSWRKCKLICLDCHQINKSCADL